LSLARQPAMLPPTTVLGTELLILFVLSEENDEQL
jgi:hypothetical protein